MNGMRLFLLGNVLQKIISLTRQDSDLDELVKVINENKFIFEFSKSTITSLEGQYVALKSNYEGSAELDSTINILKEQGDRLKKAIRRNRIMSL